jgi:GST-like protein
MDLKDYPHFKKWFEKIGERPAVQRGCAVLTAFRKPLHDDKAREQLFGSTQYQKRK